MKSYTDFEQSKKLSEMLPLESADMVWRYNVGFMCYYDGVPEFIRTINHFELCNEDIPCWSLTALFNILPHIQEFYPIIEKINDKYVCRYKENSIWTNANNPIDACYEMILKLHEKNLL